MNEVLLGILIFLPVIMAVVATAITWRRLNRPLFFLLVATLGLLGLQSLVAPVAAGAFFAGIGISWAAANEAFVRSVQLSAILVIGAGMPFLWWLSRTFMRN